MMKKTFISALSIILVLAIFLIQTTCNTPIKITQDAIEKNLQKLSKQEREYLTNLFKYLFFISSFGYTIFGDKPMSFDSIDTTRQSKSVDGFDYMALEHILGCYRTREGWEIWKKYAHLFPLKGYSIIFYTAPEHSDYMDIAIINHQKFIDTVNNHFADFQNALGMDLKPEQILEHYILHDNDVFTRIRNHDGLFGTLLGFGRKNAWEFMKRSGGKTMGAFTLERPADTKHICPPLFAVVNTQETENLREKYCLEQQEINVIYQRADFLETVLRKLMGRPNF